MTTEITTIESEPDEQQVLTTREPDQTLDQTPEQAAAVENINSPTVAQETQRRQQHQFGASDYQNQIGVSEPDIGVSGYQVGVSEFEGSQWKNRAGLPMENEDIQQFVDRSETYQFQRQMQITDDRELDEQAVGEATRDQIGEHFEDAPTQDYMYSVNSGDGHTQVDVAMTGDRDQMELDQPRLEEFQDNVEAAYDDAQGIDQDLQQDLDRQRVEEQDQLRQEQPDDHQQDLGGRNTGEMAQDYGGY